MATILLGHGSGGKLTQGLVQRDIYPFLENPILAKMDDSGVFDLRIQGRLALTTDSYVVSPIFFPGGDIGRLAVCGTVNDLSMVGAVPRYLSLSLIIEEGFSIEDLRKIMNSVRKAAAEADVKVVAGDTKVVNHGSADKIFITTAGIGIPPKDARISGSNLRPGDKLILNGSIGEHGITIMSQREGLKFAAPIESDCAPLNRLVAKMTDASENIHAMRDPTRGGLATVLNEFARQSNVGITIDEAAIPVQEPVKAACEMLGFDPLYVANEGKLVAAVAAKDAEAVLAAMRKARYGTGAVIIGEVTAENVGRVVMRTGLGTTRIVDHLTGELLPRIC